MDHMNSVLRKIVEGLVGTVTFMVFLRLTLVPTYAFVHSGSETLFAILFVLEAVFSAFIAYRVMRYIHRHL